MVPRSGYGTGCSSTQYDLDLLATIFTRAWPIDYAPVFNSLVQAIERTDAD